MAAGRRVSLVLSDGNGDVLGALPSFTVDDPWWPEVGPVVSAGVTWIADEQRAWFATLGLQLYGAD